MFRFEKISWRDPKFRNLAITILGTIGLVLTGYSISLAALQTRSIRIKSIDFNDEVMNAGMKAAHSVSIESSRDETIYIALVASDGEGKVIESLSGGVFCRPENGQAGKCTLAIACHDLRAVVNQNVPAVAWITSMSVFDAKQGITFAGPVNGWEPRAGREGIRSEKIQNPLEPGVGKTYKVWEAIRRTQRDLPDGRIEFDGPIVFRYALLVKFVKTKPTDEHVIWGRFDFRKIDEI